MEIRLRSEMFWFVVLLSFWFDCLGQEYTKKQLDGLYFNRYNLYDSLRDGSELKMNDLYTINEDKKILENIENLFGKPDYYAGHGPYPDEGIDITIYNYI